MAPTILLAKLSFASLSSIKFFICVFLFIIFTFSSYYYYNYYLWFGLFKFYGLMERKHAITKFDMSYPFHATFARRFV